jgi:hypothetical protein
MTMTKKKKKLKTIGERHNRGRVVLMSIILSKINFIIVEMT